MDAPAAVYTVPVALGCLAFSWAGLEKLRDRAPLAAVVSDMSASRRFGSIAAAGVPATELVTVLAVLAGLPSYLPSALFTLLGLAFAAAGAWSLLTGKAVSCACFGASARRLGWPQLAGLPLWLFAAWSVLRMPHVSISVRLAGAAAGFLLLVIIRAIPALRLGLNARGDRRAFTGGL